MTVEIVDETGQPATVPRALRRGTRRAATTLRLGRAAVTIKLTGEAEMARLNGVWRGGRGPTDVLSFPSHGPRRHLGDIAICPAEAARRSRAGTRCREDDLVRLAVHGLLHLLGYDHERDDGEMARLERALQRHARTGARR